MTSSPLLSLVVATILLIQSHLTTAWNFPLPGGRNVCFDDGVLRIQLEDITTLPKMPPPETLPSQSTLASIQVKDTGTKKGFGAFCTSSLAPEEFLGFYKGEQITSLDGLPNTEYVMSMDGGVTFLDGYQRAQDRTTFAPVHLNHEDRGELGCNCLRILDDGRVAFFTARQIEVGEELCFDYGANYWEGREGAKV